MKKAVMFVLRYLSVTTAFFIAGVLIIFAMAIIENNTNMLVQGNIIKILIISVLYAISSPISFSVKHFVKYSMLARLLIQTAVNYSILVICAVLFGYVTELASFYKITTIYFFAGMAAALFICLYYPRKYKLYNDGLKAYKKKALLEEYPEITERNEK